MDQKKVTKRKFYGKWLYKVTLAVPGIAILRSKSPADTIKFLKGIESLPTANIFSTHGRAKANAASIIELCNFLVDNKDVQWTKRIECSSIDFYTNDLTFYNNLCVNFKRILTQRFEPEDGMLTCSDDQYTIVTKKYPHNLYQYKVFLKPHKLKNDLEAKSQFVEWVSNQPNKILISETVKNWFIKTEWNWDRRYLLVADVNTLLMLKLRNSEVVGKVYEYKIIDK